MQRTILADGRLFGRFVAPFDPPLYTEHQLLYLERLRRAALGEENALQVSVFDRELGWCPRANSEYLGAHFDAMGARISARPHLAAPAAGARRHLALGGSFTTGLEVEDLKAWPARVEAMADGVEVVNLGVPGYGLDQAYMRYLRDGRDLGSKEVWIGLMPTAALRVSTHFLPNFNRWSSTCAFKPRFVPQGASGLRLVPNPAADHAGTITLLTDQRAFVAALGETDLWVRRSPIAFAPRGSHPLHWFATSRLALTLHESGRRDRAAWLGDPESEIYRVMRDLLAALNSACEEDGARLRILVLPSRADLVSLEQSGRGYWEDLLEDMARQGIESLDTSSALVEAGSIEDDEMWKPGGHYSERNNEVVAQEVLAHLLNR